jgi:UDP-hydrolysing UDP-N-acetyl-D-glucosamine 2-epimerase
MAGQRNIAVVTGSRADFGLLRPVMRAIREHPGLSLQTIVTGTHPLPPARTLAEVAAEFAVDAVIPMQEPGASSRQADAAALGRGISGLSLRLSQAEPDVVLVLGDRIEALAAAAAACVGGIRAAHMHGGDRAEGIADEGIRHAITKLAHIHLPATARSANRIIAMGEDPRRVHVVGSPAIDGLSDIDPLDDLSFASLGRPSLVFLLHPTGAADEIERDRAARLLSICRGAGRVVAFHPNHDPGREGILAALESSGCECREHLPRAQFVALLKRVGLIVGNSSAGLIECAALAVRCANVGHRQAGRETAANVIDLPEWEFDRIEQAVHRAAAEARSSAMKALDHPFGDGRAGERTADLLATFDAEDHGLTKRNTY